ncbi:gastrula zinc finger protein XlCGF28.1-like [Silurus asotus]|uniref:Gastrula zinc finger protein XlCGF28.1-like n=1 Tax=Silurus asotus TaxID=30991 RepID=A0AAD5B436_SILAS|nr:gastrula zinc finger protein XlCGF28.1-like [Silurus asotus]
MEAMAVATKGAQFLAAGSASTGRLSPLTLSPWRKSEQLFVCYDPKRKEFTANKQTSNEFFSVYRMDRTLDSGKSREGGVCLMVNKHWCDSANIVPLSRSCTPNLELLTIKCRPFYLPREFSLVIVSAVYIPPQVDTDTAVWDLHETLTLHQTQHRVAALIVVEDFDSANLKRALLNFYQHITCPTRGKRTLDHCYTTFKNSYKAQSRPPFGKSDHAAIFLMPVYKQRLKQEAPVQREVTRWTDQSVAALQDALDDAAWDMFQRSSDDVNMLTEAVVGFIGKLTDDTVQKTLSERFPTRSHELNTFYARFEAAANHASCASGTTSVHAERAGELNTFTISEHDVMRAFKRVKTRKAAGPNGITGQVLKACADQLAPVFTEIFNLSLEQSVVPSCFKQSTIVPVPKKPQPACLNDYRPVALTSVVIKCFERLVRDFITASLPVTLDPLQFAYRQNRSTEDAIAHLLHTTISHLDQRNGNYTKIMDYSSAFNTIIPSTLTSKLEVLGLSLPLCQWISNFLTDRPQAVRVGKHTSSTLTLSTGDPQGCVLSPLLYSLYTYDCVATSNSTTIIKFADDTVVVGLISNNDETAYLQEVKNLERWCQENNLLLNVSKTKELIVDSTKQEQSYQPLNICGLHLSWSCHINTLVKKVRQRLYHLRRLRDFKLPSQVLKTFYTCTIESVLTGSITSWFENSTMQDRRALQRVVRSAERTIHIELPDLQDIYSTRCRTRARKIVKDLSHPNNGLFSLLRSGKCFRSLKANTERMRRTFFPQAIRSLNQETPRI